MMRRTTALLAALCVVLLQSTAEADNSYYRVLAAKPNALFEDAVRVFFELAVEREPGKLSFSEQAQALVDMKIVKAKWTKAPKAKVTRGRVAYMICTACGIKGGVTMRVFGPSERYAFRECMFMGVWPAGNQRDYMTGNELMGLLKWAADYVDEHPRKKPPLRGSAKTGRKESPEEPPAEEKPAVNEKKKVEKPPKPSPKPAAKPPTTTTRYVVQKGDTFAKISIRFYGTSRHDRVIMKANGISDPWSIRPGQTLVIPKKPGAVR